MKPFAAESAPLSGNVLVEASAGTGKTYAITTLVLRLLLETELTIDQILVVTFTEAATAELRGRIRARLRRALAESRDDDARRRLSRALQHVDEAPVHTIHGFCHRVLGDCAFDSGVQFDAELLSDDKPLRDDVLLDFWTAELAGESRPGVRLLRTLGVKLDEARQLCDVVLRAPYMPVLPPMDALPREPDARALEQAMASLRRSWDRAAIDAALRSPALNKNRYREEQIAGDLDAIELLLARPLGDVPARSRALEKLSAERLADSVKQAHRGQQPRHPFFEACDALLAEIARFEAWGAARALWFKRRLCDYVRVQMPRRKEQAGVMSFDDLLLRLDFALAGAHAQRLAASVRARHPAALIDEFQDTDPVQWAIFQRIWGEDGTLFLIGDPKQAIYAFRGADVFAYMDAARGVAEERRFTMDTNWRSDPSLVRGVSALFSRSRLPFVMSAIGLPEVKARPGAGDVFCDAEGQPLSGLELLFAPRPSKERRYGAEDVSAAVAAEISRLLAAGARIAGRPVGPGDIAILTRTNRQAFEAQRALRPYGIRSVVLGDQSVFEADQPEARELSLILAAVAEPTKSSAVRAALTSELLGVTASELCDMDRTEAGARAWSAWVDRFRELNAIWSQRGFVQMFRALMSLTDMEQRLLTSSDGERRITNVLHLMELLHTAATTLHLGPVGLMQWLAIQRAPQNAKLRPEAAQIRLESDDDAVKITTIHRSKGLEYPIVYCPSSWDGLLLYQSEKQNVLFHDPDDGEALKLDLTASERSIERAEWEKLAENLRLLYVALTRARHRCTVVWGAVRSSYATSALGYLLHPPPLGGAPSVAALRAHLESLDDARMQAELRSIGGIRVRTLDLGGDGVVYLPREASTRPLRARALSHPVERSWRTASFSELASSRPDRLRRLGDASDHDAAPAAPAPAAPPELVGPITLEGFPRGPRAGNFFHALLEELDFAADDPGHLAGLIEGKLSAHGYDVERYAEMVQRALEEVLDTPLPAGKRRKLCLRRITADQRVAELEFYLPVASAHKRTLAPRGTQLSLFAGSPSRPGRLTPRALADVLAAHPSAELDAAYVAQLARLSFLPLEGFLKGFIDLVFCHEERWYLADYKTNHLGDDLAHYAAPRLLAAMSHGHYYLQYHLYAVALHRHLSRRIRGYDYDKHFGGVHYLFLKGMSPRSQGQTGVFFERPPRARIEALSDLLDHPQEGRGA